MKHFIITVDTEGDNLWEYKKELLQVQRMLNICLAFNLYVRNYGFKPVYLTNYEMASSDTFVTEAKNGWIKGIVKQESISMHGIIPH